MEIDSSLGHAFDLFVDGRTVLLTISRNTEVWCGRMAPSAVSLWKLHDVWMQYPVSTVRSDARCDEAHLLLPKTWGSESFLVATCLCQPDRRMILGSHHTQTTMLFVLLIVFERLVILFTFLCVYASFVGKKQNTSVKPHPVLIWMLLWSPCLLLTVTVWLSFPHFV